MVLPLDSFILKWQATAAQSTVPIKQFNFNVLTFLCFSGALVPLGMAPMVLVKVYSIALHRMKNPQEPREIAVCCNMHFPGETNCSQGAD